MKNSFIFNFNVGRRGRALGVPALAAGALVLLLLSLGSGQSAAMGPGMVAAPPAQGSVAPSDVGALAADDVSIVKSVSNPWAKSGDRINYTLSIANGSTAMSGVVVTDPRPGELINVTTSGTLPYTEVGNTFVIGSLAASQTGVITINGQISAGYTSRTLITNTATITATGDTITTNNTSTAVITFWPSVFHFPLMIRGTGSPIVSYYDDFSDPSRGWYQGNGWYQGGDCYYKYITDGTEHYYRMGVRKTNYVCLMYNPNILPMHDGTFIVRARRTDASNDPIHYGFYFDAGSSADKYHWLVQVRPDDVTCDDKSQPYFWLSWQEGSNGDQVNEGKDSCSGAIKTGHNWNEIKAVRSGNNIKIYLNGTKEYDGNPGRLSDPSLYAYFDLYVLGLSNDATYVDFDYVSIAP